MKTIDFRFRKVGLLLGMDYCHSISLEYATIFGENHSAPIRLSTYLKTDEDATGYGLCSGTDGCIVFAMEKLGLITIDKKVSYLNKKNYKLFHKIKYTPLVADYIMNFDKEEVLDILGYTMDDYDKALEEIDIRPKANAQARKKREEENLLKNSIATKAPTQVSTEETNAPTNNTSTADQNNNAQNNAATAPVNTVNNNAQNHKNVLIDPSSLNDDDDDDFDDD